jgi:cell division transport system permease protein
LGDLAAASDSNPFPAELEIQVANVNQVSAVNNEVLRSSVLDPIYPTSYNKDAYDKIQRVLLAMTIVGVGFLVLLGFIAVTVTANSIRAAIHSRRDEVKIMQLVGAPRWMVRGPFLVEGALTGGLAGAIAGLLTFFACVGAVQAGASTFAQFAPGVTLLAGILAAFLIFFIGLGLGSGASLLSLRRHLET